LFCPQCGLATSSSQSANEEASAASAQSIGNTTNVNAGATLVDYEPPVEEEANAPSDVNLADTVSISSTPPQTQRASDAPHTLQTESKSIPPDDRREPPGSGLGNIERRIMPGVNKLRKGTSIVIDEASYDPSLRFVLIALILFVLFLVLLILSKWIG